MFEKAAGHRLIGKPANRLKIVLGLRKQQNKIIFLNKNS